ncbi:MAG: ribokinase [Candidatus Krumholzibacteriia bacterium]
MLVAGSINMDVVATAERHPKIGETVAGRELRYFPGGKGANQAVAAARMGARTVLAAKLGRDFFADELESFLREHRVELTHTARTAEASTGTALIVVDAASDNTIVVVPGANDHLSAGDVTCMEIGPGDILVSQFEIPLPTVESFLAHGKSNGATTILNPAPARPCPRHLLERVDILVLNETELCSLLQEAFSGSQDRELFARAAGRLQSRPDQVIIVTLGSRGAVALVDARVLRIPGRAVEAVDTTGAGDCYVGALAAQLAAGQPLEAALNTANVAASICVQAMGAGASMPDRRAVESVMAAEAAPRSASQ